MQWGGGGNLRKCWSPYGFISHSVCGQQLYHLLMEKKTDGTALGFEIKQGDDGLPRHEAFINTCPCGFITCS